MRGKPGATGPRDEQKHPPDTTRWRQMEGTDSLTRQRLNSMLASRSTVIYTRQPHPPHIVTFISDNVSHLLGYTPARFYRDDALWEQLLRPDDAARVLDGFATVCDVGRLAIEYRMRHRDGRWLWVLDEQRRVAGHAGDPREIAGCLHDVTELRHLQEQLRQSQKVEAIGLLAGGMAHDFNNMLTVVLGYADLALADGPRLDTELRSALEEIRSAGERAVSMTRQLLLFSRKQELKAEPVDLNRIIEDIRKLLRPLLGEHITQEVCLEPALPCVRADPGQIQQILFNLSINARDAMPSGGCLSIRTSSVDGEDGSAAGPARRVQLLVSDSGHGMDDQTKSRIFDPFFTTKGSRGTGLGLATVLSTVKQLDGSLRVDSRPGAGTSFRITLPACDEQPPSPRGAAGATLTGVETVLLVEDDEPLARFVAAVLERAGYRTYRARDGHEALTLCAMHAEPIHLLVTDVIMPGMSGGELAARIRARHPEIRVLFMSGYGQEKIIDYGVVLDPRSLLRKPFTAMLLKQKVRAILEMNGGFDPAPYIPLLT